MSDAERTEIELEEGAYLPAAGAEREETPFAELSRLMVVAIDPDRDDRLCWNAQTAPNGPWGTAWTPVSDTAYILLGTGATMDGRVAMVAQTEASPPAVHYIDEAPQGPGGSERWNAPINLGMPDGAAGFVQLAMTRDTDGRIEVFGVDEADGNVWWIHRNPPKIVDRTEKVTPPGSTTPITVHVKVAEPPDEPWSAWIPLPGQHVSRLTAASNADGRVVLIATGQDPKARAVHVNQQKAGTARSAADWTGWTRIDDAMSGTAGSQPTAALDRQGAVNIFMVGALAEVAYIRQHPPGGTGWTGWARPGMTGEVLSNVTAGLNGDGEIVLAAVGEQSQLFMNMQFDARFQQWTGWQRVARLPGFGEIAMDYNADGRLSFFGSNSRAGDLFLLSQVARDSTGWDAGFTVLADGGIGSYGVVRDLTPPGAD